MRARGRRLRRHQAGQLRGRPRQDPRRGAAGAGRSCAAAPPHEDLAGPEDRPLRAAPVRHRDRPPERRLADDLDPGRSRRVAWRRSRPGPESPPDVHVSMPEESRRATTRLDPRSPLVLDTRELGRRPGSMRRLSRSVPAPAHLGRRRARRPGRVAGRAGPPARVGGRGRPRLRHGVSHHVGGVRALSRPGHGSARGRPAGALRLPRGPPGPGSGRRGRRHGAVAGDRR